VLLFAAAACSSNTTTSPFSTAPAVTPLVGSAVATTPADHAGPPGAYPNPALTPGAVFADVTAAQVCAPGYSKGVRDVSSAEKAEVYRRYGIRDTPGAHEVDHFVPLELGGSNELQNLWPEPYTPPGAHEKDRVEDYLHREVCAGRMSLAEAQQRIRSDWYAVYQQIPGGR